MRDAEIVKLRDVASRVVSRNSVGNANVLTISAAHGFVSQENYFSRRVASSNLSQYYLVRKGDFAYNKSYSVGWPAGVVRRLQGHAEGVVSPLYICFRPDSRRVDPSFLQYYFDSGILNDDILWIAKEGARNHGLLNVGVEDFFDLSLRLPSLPEQRRIAEVIAEIDAQISTARAVLQKREMAQSGLLAKLFESGLHLGRGSIQSAIGELPSGWKVLPISEVCEVGSGSTPSRAEGELFFSPSGVPWVKTLDLNEGVISVTQECVTEIALQSFRMRTYRPGTVLLAMYGGWGQIGRTAMLGCPAAVNQALSALEVKEGVKVLPEFLHLALQHGRLRWRKMGASTRKDANITKSDVEAFLIPIPEIHEQDQITRIMADLSHQKLEGDAFLAKLQLLKRSAMVDLFSGQVRVPCAV
ncbi:restriction endonuclease subunit S [Streptomyces massasporeus]